MGGVDDYSPETDLFRRALINLADREGRYRKNYWVFRDQTEARRLRWIDHIEAQAAKGLPFAERVISEVITLRLKQ